MVSFRDAKKFKIKTSERLMAKKPTRLAAAQKAKFSKRRRAQPRSAVNANLKAWGKTVKAPTVTNKPFAIKGRLITRNDMTALRKVRTSDSPLTEALAGQKLDAPALVGLQWSSLTVFEYAQAKTAYTQSLRKIKGSRSLTAAKRQELQDLAEKGWAAVVGEFSGAFGKAGVRGVTEKKLDDAAKHLVADTPAFNEFKAMAADVQGKAVALRAAPRTVTGLIVPDTAAMPLLDLVDFKVPFRLCPFDPIRGVRTEHFSASFALKTTISYPCGVKWCKKYGIPYPCGVKWCKKTITLIGGSVEFSLEVGYEIDCCGAEAWGSAFAEACGTIANQTLCARCEASVTAAIGVGDAASVGGQCSYGLGLVVAAKCSLAGYTVLQKSFPFGWNILAPCPPAALCK